MHVVERLCLQLRHSGWLGQQAKFWDIARPIYNGLLRFAGTNGLPRSINGSDRLRVLPSLRGLPETYEPQVWRELFATLREGDTMVDVGASVGLYTIVAAKRVGAGGRVIAFEPDLGNYVLLAAQVTLNSVAERVQLVQAAAGSNNSKVIFSSGKSSESHVDHHPHAAGSVVECVRLDTFFADRRVDLIKIDVEGYEEEVLKGAIGILTDVSRRPRAIFIEAHPYAWGRTGASDQSLIRLLNESGYRVCWLDGQQVDRISALSEIVARCDDDAKSVQSGLQRI